MSGEVERIDHIELGISRLATQYSESKNAIAYIEALLSQANEIESSLIDIICQRSLETARGAQLDVIADIVGQSRTIIDSNLIAYFGFETVIQANSFGDLGDQGIGGRFRSLNESTTGNRLLTDDEFLLFIRTRIVTNSISPTIPSMIEFMSSLFEVDDIRITEGDASYTITIGRPLSTNEQVFLINTNLIPKVAGVAVQYQMLDNDGNELEIN